MSKRGAPDRVDPSCEVEGACSPTGRARSLFAACASLSFAAAVLAAVARAIEPFAHGIWLVAYLFLVGFLAQLLLGRWQASLLADRVSGAISAPVRTQAGLWNAGVVAVPLGVLGEVRVLVVLGSVALLVSLAAFWQTYRSLGSGTASRALRMSYVALIAFMGASVLVGAALAWDIPWL